MNTLGRIRRLFPEAAFENCSYVVNGPPAYNFGCSIVARLLLLYGRFTPPALGQHLAVFLRRRKPPPRVDLDGQLIESTGPTLVNQSIAKPLHISREFPLM
jgi:hypothetical protein